MTSECCVEKQSGEEEHSACVYPRDLTQTEEILHFPDGSEVLFASRNLTCESKRQLEVNSTEKCISGGLQRCTNSRWLADRPDHSRNNNSSTWPADVLPVIFYSLGAISTLNKGRVYYYYHDLAAVTAIVRIRRMLAFSYFRHVVTGT